ALEGGQGQDQGPAGMIQVLVQDDATAVGVIADQAHPSGGDLGADGDPCAVDPRFGSPGGEGGVHDVAEDAAGPDPGPAPQAGATVSGLGVEGDRSGIAAAQVLAVEEGAEGAEG